MRRFLVRVAFIAVVLFAVAAGGGALPEGNPVRDVTQVLRDFGNAVAGSFGGGYTMTTP